MNLSSINDLSLVAQVIAGATDRAFGRLVDKYQQPVRRFFLHQTLGDRMLSDDLAQDTFIRAYSSIHQFQQLSSFKTWLMSIAYHVWQDHLRKEERTLSPALPLYGEGGREEDRMDTLPIEGEGQGEGQLISLDIYTALSQLTDIERTCVTLFYIDDMPGNRISQITGLPPATVRSHIHRGKQRLSSFLKQNGYG
ncbi:MAG: sigma-70 family RNA polymerase sigma factor [Bacteroidaceae bacterium]|nr:sigma-70 family RNA polymerase sigma factor [Bacteroidaceae bacterium]